MLIKFWVAGKAYKTDLSKGQSVAIPLLPDGAQPNHFAAPVATASPLRAGEFIGDTKQGGSCNVAEIKLVSHCNGTHTESVSHIIDELIPPAEAITQSLFPTTLISIVPELADSCSEQYLPRYDQGHRVISKSQLVHLLADIPEQWLTGLTVRTLPNHSEKLSRCYDHENYPPYFTNEAINYLVARGVQHLMVDFPSIDKMYDDGLMSNHHLFWQIEAYSHTGNENMRRNATVSEMLFVNDAIEDGHYLCQLQPLSIATDAVPSNPTLYRVQES